MPDWEVIDHVANLRESHAITPVLVPLDSGSRHLFGRFLVTTCGARMRGWTSIGIPRRTIEALGGRHVSQSAPGARGRPRRGVVESLYIVVLG